MLLQFDHPVDEKRGSSKFQLTALPLTEHSCIRKIDTIRLRVRLVRYRARSRKLNGTCEVREPMSANSASRRFGNGW
jgi:hypothetical protein